MEKVNYHGFEISTTLKTLIEHSLTDGKISVGEEEAIYERAKKENYSDSEIKVLLDSVLHERKKNKRRNFYNTILKPKILITIGSTIAILTIIILIITNKSEEDMMSDIRKSLENNDYEKAISYINQFHYTYKPAGIIFNHALTNYNFEYARKVLPEVSDGLADKLYQEEIMYFAKNEAYDKAFSSSENLYAEIKHSRERIADDYLPSMMSFIGVLMENDKQELAKKYANKVPNDAVKSKLMQIITGKTSNQKYYLTYKDALKDNKFKIANKLATRSSEKEEIRDAELKYNINNNNFSKALEIFNTITIDDDYTLEFTETVEGNETDSPFNEWAEADNDSYNDAVKEKNKILDLIIDGYVINGNIKKALSLCENYLPLAKFIKEDRDYSWWDGNTTFKKIYKLDNTHKNNKLNELNILK